MLTWRIALAPRPRAEPVGRHWWRQLVTETYRAAAAARDSLRESAQDAGGQVAGTAGSTAGYLQLTEAEFDELVPRVRLGDVMRELSSGAREPALW